LFQSLELTDGGQSGQQRKREGDTGHEQHGEAACGIDLIARVECQECGQRESNRQHRQSEPKTLDQGDERGHHHRENEGAADDMPFVEISQPFHTG
jgi:hypothetical protein